jgi:hypothetical protein
MNHVPMVFRARALATAADIGGSSVGRGDVAGGRERALSLETGSIDSWDLSPSGNGWRPRGARPPPASVSARDPPRRLYHRASLSPRVRIGSASSSSRRRIRRKCSRCPRHRAALPDPGRGRGVDASRRLPRPAAPYRFSSVIGALPSPPTAHPSTMSQWSPGARTTIDSPTPGPTTKTYQSWAPGDPGSPSRIEI